VKETRFWIPERCGDDFNLSWRQPLVRSSIFSQFFCFQSRILVKNGDLDLSDQSHFFGCVTLSFALARFAHDWPSVFFQSL
jgi:hypothetical protein